MRCKEIVLLLSVVIFSCNCNSQFYGKSNIQVTINDDSEYSVTLEANKGNKYFPNLIDDGKYDFAQIPVGKYKIIISPGDESWKPEYLLTTYVDIQKKQEYLEFKVPDGTLNLALDQVDLPKYKENLAIAKVQKTNNGQLLSSYLQWVFFKKINGVWSGTLYYLEEGQYKLTFLSRNKDSRKQIAISLDIISSGNELVVNDLKILQ
jgi:hypothetical protein